MRRATSQIGDFDLAERAAELTVRALKLQRRGELRRASLTLREATALDESNAARWMLYAHVLLQLDRDVRKVSVTLDTTEQPRLRPQNPSRTFELHGKDAILVMDQPFSAPSRPTVRLGAAPKRHIPYKIQ